MALPPPQAERAPALAQSSSTPASHPERDPAALARRSRALDAISHAIAASLDVGEVFGMFAEQAAELVPHDAISVTLLGDDGCLERFALATATPIGPAVGERQTLAETVAGLVVREGRPVWTNQMAGDPRFAGANDRRWIAEGFSSFISAPLRAKGRVIGALNILSRASSVYSETDVAAAQEIADRIAIVLDTMQLHERLRQLAVVEERNRIARDLHDTLVQSLTCIVLQLEAAEHNLLDAERLRADLRQAREIARGALAEARRSVWELRPSALERQPLPDVLREELERWSRASGVPARLFVRGEGALGIPVEVAILRIAQEALHNIHKYAQAQEARVELEYADDEVRLIVGDDGAGFTVPAATPPGGAAGGLGLTAMRERASEAGGRLSISSWPGNGTRVEARFPRQPSEPPGRLASGRQSDGAPARVLVVDDHTLIRQGIVGLIAQMDGLAVVGQASSGAEACDQAQRLQPDLVLLDMRLQSMDGAATAAELTRALPEVKVVMLTSSDAPDDLARAVQAGAHGYVLKEAPIDQLEQAIRAVLRGEAAIEARLTRHLVDRFAQTGGHPRADELSERELEVLRLVVAGRRNREIAEALVISEHTVKSHISSIFAKLGVTDRASAVGVALQRNIGGLSLRAT